MVILAIDTSGRHGSVALCRGDAASFEVLGIASLEGGTYSARLIPVIGDLRDNAGLTNSQIEGLAVVDGPGSFTGLRVGLSTVKALCEILQKPLATVSMLEALAATHGSDGFMFTAVMDAGRGEVYVGEFEIATPGARLKRQFIVKLLDLGNELSWTSRIVTTFPKLTEALPGFASVEVVPELRADSIARIGLLKLLAGDTADPATLDANYIRRSDAELFSLPKR